MEPHSSRRKSGDEVGTQVTAVPYLGSAGWYRRFCVAQCPRGSQTSLSAPGPLSHKDCHRTMIAGAEPGIMLTVPVAGGASALKRLPPQRLLISNHGRWQHVHLSAIATAYRRTPFFPHLYPEIENILLDTPESLDMLNRSLHRVITDFMQLSRFTTDYHALSDAAKATVDARARELLANLRPDLSVLDILFRLGPEAALPLAARYTIEGE